MRLVPELFHIRGPSLTILVWELTAMKQLNGLFWLTLVESKRGYRTMTLPLERTLAQSRPSRGAICGWLADQLGLVAIH